MRPQVAPLCLTWKNMVIQCFVDLWLVRTGSRGNRVDGISKLSVDMRTEKHHLKFTNIFRSRFANQPMANPSIGRLHILVFLPTIPLFITTVLLQ